MRAVSGSAGMRLRAPHELGRTRRTRLTALALLLTTIIPSFAESDDPDLVRSERAAEALIIQRINAERATLAPDAPSLASDPTLEEIARSRSDAMAHGAPFSHEDANGRAIAIDMMRARFGPYGAWGENILEEHGFRVFDPARFSEQAVAGWMSSPGHRKNILSAAYSRSSIGVKPSIRNGSIHGIGKAGCEIVSTVVDRHDRMATGSPVIFLQLSKHY